jgi:voltage-gated potassium channel
MAKTEATKVSSSQDPLKQDPLNQSQFKQKLYQVIFGYESKAGRLFDLVLIITIFASVLAVMLDSVASINTRFHDQLYLLEWVFTVLFTVEYLLRLYCTPSTRGYAFSFYGLIDLFSILPTYIAFLWPGGVYLIVIRSLRVLRVFRILKLARYVGEANLLLNALVNARHKIFVFLYGLLILIIIFGSLMFLVEGPEHGFDSIPHSIYWAIVTITTVGYGDIVPQTPIGQIIAGAAMITGYAVIAVPFGIISSELINEQQKRRDNSDEVSLRVCKNCNQGDHDEDAHFCKQCGVSLDDESGEKVK